MTGEEVYFGWMSDDEFVEYVDPRTPLEKALWARMDRLLGETRERELDLEFRLQMADHKLRVAERDIKDMMEG